MDALDRYASAAMRRCFSKPTRLLHLLEAACMAARVTDAELDLEGELADAVALVRDDYYAEYETAGVGAWLDEWDELEARFHHDIAAVVELVRRRLPDRVARYFHLGRTSSDLVDTALAFTLTDATELVDAARHRLTLALARSAEEFASDPIPGRTHGQAAELTSIGRRLALAAVAVDSTGLRPYRFAKLTGPVGVRSPVLAAEVLHRVGLHSPPSSQIVPRHLLAALMGDVAAATVALSDVAMMIRLGSREDAGTGSRWLSESRGGPEARGSSSMPTKRNPVRAEKVSGLCVFIRSTAGAVTEAAAGLWEERDISHSSVERIGLESIFTLLEHCYDTLAEVIRTADVRTPTASEIYEFQFTPARALEYAVEQGATYAEAYRDVALSGPAHVLQARTELVNWYNPALEPGLWSRVRSLLPRAD